MVEFEVTVSLLLSRCEVAVRIAAVNLLCFFMKILDTFPRVLFDMPSRFLLHVIQENEAKIVEQASRLPLSFPFDPDIFEEQRSIGPVELPFQASEFSRMTLSIPRTPTLLPTLSQRQMTPSSSSSSVALSFFSPTDSSSSLSSRGPNYPKKDKNGQLSAGQFRMGKLQESLLGLNEVDNDLWAATLGNSLRRE